MTTPSQLRVNTSARAVLAFALPLIAALLADAAKPGDVDTSFGGDGKVRTKFHAGHDAAASVAVDSRGGIVAAGTTSIYVADSGNDRIQKFGP